MLSEPRFKMSDGMKQLADMVTNVIFPFKGLLAIISKVKEKFFEEKSSPTFFDGMGLLPERMGNMAQEAEGLGKAIKNIPSEKAVTLTKTMNNVSSEKALALTKTMKAASIGAATAPAIATAGASAGARTPLSPTAAPAEAPQRPIEVVLKLDGEVLDRRTIKFMGRRAQSAVGITG